ncbi:MAG: DUF4350 domain-containing protein [Actinophytocola sp.]|nr:DUF4350 domain-containing protein [Actinophytocola sp.]
MTTPVTPDTRQVWRAARGPLAILLLIVTVAIVLTLLRGNSEGGSLDPRSAAPDGSRALAALLGDYGVDVERVHTLAAATRAADGDATVLVTHPNLLAPSDLDRISGQAGGLVLIAPNQELARVADPDIEVGGTTADAPHTPECALVGAAGEATIGGVGYRTPHGERCYPTTAGASLVRVGPVTLLGIATPLTNDALDEDGNAALSLRLLGERERLVWYLPSPGDQGRGTASLLTLLPPGWKYGLATLAIAAVLLAVWRARRLGPVVTEPLPVVVHAAETTEGRARLYRRAGAADHAAEALRAAARHRIAAHAGLTTDAGPEAVVAAASRASDAHEAYWLLYGPAPSDDAALVRLAAELDRLENEVREA